jgi:hypothetical protein
MKPLILFLALPLMICISSSKCNHKPDNPMTFCDSLDYKSAEYVYLYQMESDISYADSAIDEINTALSKCSDVSLQNKLKIRKLGLLATKEEYQEALEFINRSVGDEIIPGLTYYKGFLTYRFNAMHFQHTGNYSDRDSCLRLLTLDIEDFLKQNERKVSRLKKETAVKDLLKNPLHIPVMQYYYYQSILMGNAQFETKLKEEISKGRISNFFYFQVLEFNESADFMHFNGF